MKKLVVFLCLVQFVDVLGVTELITATPGILTALHAPGSSASLLLTAYAMCFGGLLMFGARLGDRIGHRRTLLLGVGAFALGSLLAAAAPSAYALVAGRCLQGIAAAISVPAALRLLIGATPRVAQRRRALAAWSAAGAAAGALGYLVGGGLTELAGWRAMFWINLPIAAVIGTGVLRYAREGPPPERGERIDALGALLFTAAVMCLVLAGSRLEQPGHAITGLLVIAVAVALSGALAGVERKAPRPLLPIDALRQRNVRIGTGAAFLNTATTSSAAAIATLELQRTQQLTPAEAGLRLLPFSICVVAGSALSGLVLRRASARSTIAAGLMMIAAGNALLAVTLTVPSLLAGVGLAGAGIGLSSVASTAVGTDLPESLQGAATGALNTAAQLGTAVGTAALLALTAVTAHAVIPIHGAQLGWLVAALIATAGAATIARSGRVHGPARFRDQRSPGPAAQRR